MKKVFITLLAIFIGQLLMAQKGTLRGTVYDSVTNETLIGATILKEGTTIGVQTDFDGQFSLQLEPGKHTIIFQFISYTTQRVEDVEIISNKVTVMNIKLGQNIEELGTVVVTATEVRNNVVAMDAVKRKETRMIDGGTSESFKRIGDNNAGDALKRITGVAVQEGKHVFVRGLGDRYTKTLLNSMSIPGLDPDKNSVQVDIFPTNLVDNIIIYKTFSPDLPGDFTGGLVDVKTKNFPDDKTISFGYRTSFNPDMNLNTDNIMFDSGNTFSFLGFNGKQGVPISPTRTIPDNTEGDRTLTYMTSKFDKVMRADKGKNWLNQGFSFSYSDQRDKGKNGKAYKLGYNAMINYSIDNLYYDNVEFGRYIKRAAAEDFELNKEEVRKGVLGQRDALLSGILSVALKKDSSSYTLNLFQTLGGTTQASNRISENFEQTGATLVEDILTYSQRSMSNAMLSGKHKFKKWDLNWSNSISYSTIDDPDFRLTALSVDQFTLDTALIPGDGATIARYFRELSELNNTFRVDMKFPISLKNGNRSYVKYGLQETYKERDFRILSYTFDHDLGAINSQIQGDPNWFFEEENIWTPEKDEGTYLISSPLDPANTYFATQFISAGYLLNELPISKLFKATYGIRIEHSKMFYTGQDQQGEHLYVNTETLNELNVLPSLNLIYNLSEKSNLRASFNHTLARPSFKEKSIAQIFDPITKRTFIGNIDLEETKVKNIDLRWEAFPKLGETFSATAFYKHFDGHIEVVSFETAPDNVQPINSGTSGMFGLELEFRKDLGFLSDDEQKFTLVSNVTLIESRLDMNEVILPSQTETEFDIRRDNARTGETIDQYRKMSGQPPFMVNGSLNYQNNRSGIDGNVSYNVQGKSLAIVGMGRVPDVYTQPFHSLNLKISKKIGKENKSKLSVSATNIIDQNRVDLYESFNAQDQTYSRFEIGRSFGVSYNYSF
ncbi:MAG: TonB-dependent receptor [Flavobacteriales bacterium]|nr:TonB-dependent receptor [Flavobacteriales bacterium]